MMVVNPDYTPSLLYQTDFGSRLTDCVVEVPVTHGPRDDTLNGPIITSLTWSMKITNHDSTVLDFVKEVVCRLLIRGRLNQKGGYFIFITHLDGDFYFSWKDKFIVLWSFTIEL